MYEYVRETADDVSWGTGAYRGSFNPKYKQISARSLFTVFSDGVLSINFSWLNDDDATLEFRKTLKEALEDKARLTFPSDYEEKHVPFEAQEWTDKVPDIISGLGIAIGQASNKATADGA